MRSINTTKKGIVHALFSISLMFTSVSAQEPQESSLEDEVLLQGEAESKHDAWINSATKQLTRQLTKKLASQLSEQLNGQLAEQAEEPLFTPWMDTDPGSIKIANEEKNSRHPGNNFPATRVIFP